ncbi:MAG: hypothetical protein KDB03_19215 [Planctomycetales bacterium]|nr:hypothetical protein [Planctomycetales bacterium]
MSNTAIPTAEVATHPQHNRETIESIVVAFILAFLFRAFVAEAFVIPTGSMAPTLMGAHKDLFCEYCGQPYQATASTEFDNQDAGQPTQNVTIASSCSNCRGLNRYDLYGDANQATFSGDRILVSKFDYILSSPKRWDVFVFKYPKGARQNYIKRLIGLPQEELLIQEGDVFTRTSPDATFTIARKPPHKILAMRQLVSDTYYQPKILNQQGWPSLWQPWKQGDSAQNNAWEIQQADDSWSAHLASTNEQEWLRYYHKFVDDEFWLEIIDGGKLPQIDPRRSQLITDYQAYNSSYHVDRTKIFEKGGRSFVPEIVEGNRAFDVVEFQDVAYEVGSNGTNEGYHWVGDLLGEFEVQVESDEGSLLLDLVEFGLHFRCSLDVSNGNARLTALDGDQPATIFDGNSELTADTAVSGKGRYTLSFANFDDQIVLWVNGRVVQFSGSSNFDSQLIRSGSQRRPYWDPNDPLDAAPVGIGGQGIELTVHRARVFRDIYYIAGQSYSDFCDYNLSNLPSMLEAIPDPVVRQQIRNSFGSQKNRAFSAVSMIYANPEWWSETSLFAQRTAANFQLEEEQYFPMGDNSAASSDARVWNNHNYVEQKYLLGKALLVFWPHYWNRPIPFTPNIRRMRTIR